MCSLDESHAVPLLFLSGDDSLMTVDTFRTSSGMTGQPERPCPRGRGMAQYTYGCFTAGVLLCGLTGLVTGSVAAGLPGMPPTPDPNQKHYECRPGSGPCNPVPGWEPTWDMNRSTMLQVCNFTGPTAPGTIRHWGLVDFDWENVRGRAPPPIHAMLKDEPSTASTITVTAAAAAAAKHAATTNTTPIHTACAAHHHHRRRSRVLRRGSRSLLAVAVNTTDASGVATAPRTGGPSTSRWTAKSSW